MQALTSFLDHLDWTGLLFFLMSIAAALLCITIHELSHGLIAYRLGDPTAKLNGRLTLNPIAHLDPIGLLLMITVGIGWAKPVPVDMRNFKNPKKGMAITALAGPVSNFLLSTLMLGIGSVIFRVMQANGGEVNQTAVYAIMFLCYVSILSIGLGVFNLIPIPPLDGSKILFSFLPDKIYLTILKYERFVILLVVLLSWSGALGGPLSAAISAVGKLICTITGFPYPIFYYYCG